MKRQLLVLVGLVVLAAVCVAPGAGAVDPAGACEGVAGSLSGQEKAVVGMTAAGEGPATGETTLYAGSNLSLALCRADGDVVRTRGGQGWDLSPHPVVARKTDRGTHWRVEVAASNETATVRNLVENKQSVTRGVTVRVQTGLGYQSALTGETLVFRNRVARTRVRDNESRFVAAVEAVAANATALNETRQAVDSGGPVTDNETERANETLARIIDARESMRQRRTTTRRILYDSAATGTARTGRTLDVIETVDRRDRRTTERARAAVQSYHDAVERRIAALEGTVVRNLLLGLAAGCLVGLVAGAVPPYRAASEYTDFRATTSSASYDRSVITYPVAAGAVLALLGLGLVVATGGLGVIL